MKKPPRPVLFCITITLLSILILVSASYTSEIKTVEEFKNSAFVKKYRQKRQMTSSQLRTEISAEARRFVDERLIRELGRGYGYSFHFHLGDPPTYDEYDYFSVDVVTKCKDNPIIYHIGIEFHDESIPPSSGQTTFNKHIREIFQDFISSLDSSLPLKNVADYIQEQSILKYQRKSDAPKKTLGKYSFRAGTMLWDLFISIDKAQ